MRFTLAFLLAPVVFAQTPKRLEFEVAAVKQVAQLQGTGSQTPAVATVNPSQIRLAYLTMQDFIVRAYGVKAYQIVGPDWLKTERYDISATLPEGATQAQVPAMMKSLLEDRFGIKLHKSQKEFSVYTLTRNKRPLTLTEVPAIHPGADVTGVIPNQPGVAGVSLNVGQGGVFSLGTTKVEGKGMTMEMFANTLAPFMGLPTVDGTELKGFYDFSFDIIQQDYSPLIMRAASARGVSYPPQILDQLANSAPASLFTSLDKAGLKLEKAKAPLDVIVIDTLNKTPTEN